MDYFRILNLEREPFSNSPEPAFFYQSSRHLGCLQQLELAIRLRRGLDVVIGDVGTGKTTLCRELIQRLSLSEADTEVFETHLILDPSFSDPLEFLSTVAHAFGISNSGDRKTEWQFKEEIKTVLFKKGVDEGKIMVLIIDEGQKIPGFCLEILREFLNYETNEHKLLQIVIFAQMEFEQILKERVNLADRINLYYHLKPLNFRETRGMILFRLLKASPEGTEKPPAFFTFAGFLSIYRETGGYPRRINMLCHQMLLAMIIQNQSKGSWWLARSCARRTNPLPSRHSARPALAGLLILAAVVLAGMILCWHFSRFPGLSASIAIPFPRSISMFTEKERPNSSAGGNPDDVQSAERGKVEGARRGAPEFLGYLHVVKGRTITAMMKTLYGDADYSRMEAVLQANPEVKDLNQVVCGTKLRFPAISSGARPPEGAVLVKVSSEQSLEAAYEAVRKRNGRLPPVRLLPYWNRREGLVLAILLKETFPDKTSAMEALQKLPPSIAGKAKLLDSWDPSTVFYGRL